MEHVSGGGPTRTVRGVRLVDRAGLSDVVLTEGAISAIEPHDPAGLVGASGSDYKGEGRVAIPGLVDAHVHLDKAYVMAQLARLGAFEQGGIAAAIDATARLRAMQVLEDLRPGAEQLLERMHLTGTVAARVHVEIDPLIDLATVELHRELATKYPVALQLVAFPQNGTSGRGDMHLRMERALDDGCTVVGGCPYADADPAQHLALICGLAADRGLPLDIHADLTDDVQESQLELIFEYVERFALQGKVTLGHVTSLSAMEPVRRGAMIDKMSDIGIALVGLPTTDLWLSGRSRTHDQPRGLMPVRELLAAGLSVSLASNNHQNAFTPVSSGGLLRVAWLAGLIAHIGDPAGQQQLLDAVSSIPAQLLGLGPWGIEVGSRAPLLVLSSSDPLDAVREAPAVVARIDAPAD